MLNSYQQGIEHQVVHADWQHKLQSDLNAFYQSHLVLLMGCDFKIGNFTTFGEA